MLSSSQQGKEFYRIKHQGLIYKVSAEGLSTADGSVGPLWDYAGTATELDLTQPCVNDSVESFFELRMTGQPPVLVDRPLLLGRSSRCDIPISDPSVSRFHALVLPGGDCVRIVDLDSQNGTHQAGIPVRDEEYRQSGTLYFGRFPVEISCSKPGHMHVELSSPAMAHVAAVVSACAPSRAPVVVFGESGVGKEAVARRLHVESGRSGPLIILNAATLTPNLARSELFGHTAGAFTGAEDDRQGAFALADRGTLFLDEICDLPLAAQADLLRALDSGEIMPLGASEPRWVDVRLVVATNRPLSDAVNSGPFRLDLFYRLSVLEVVIPPLRDRPDDICSLAEGFLSDLSRSMKLTESAKAWLLGRRWSGNIRELRSLITRVALLKPDGNDIDSEALEALAEPRLGTQKPKPLRAEVLEAWRQHGHSPSAAAKALGIHRATVHRHLREERRSSNAPT